MRVALAARLSGGVGVYSVNLVRALATTDPDLEVDLLTPDPVPDDVAVRAAVRPVALRHRLPTHPGWLLDALGFRRALEPLRGTLDLVHFTDSRHAFFSTGLGKPVVGTMNDYFYATVSWRPASVRRLYRDWLVRYPLYQLARVGERRALRRLSRIIAISDAVAKTVGRAYAVPSDRFATVSYGLDFSEIPANDGAIRSCPTILFVGGNFQRKGLLTLLEALPVVLTHHPDARLTVIGRSYDSRGARRLAERLGVSGRCDFLGGISHRALLDHYGAASVLAMPSLMEAFGIPYLEAMSCGLPVVATACEGPDEFLCPEENALVVPPGDASSLAGALVRLLGDQALRDRLRAGGQRTVLRFTPARMASETLAVYRSVLAGGPASR